MRTSRKCFSSEIYGGLLNFRVGSGNCWRRSCRWTNCSYKISIKDMDLIKVVESLNLYHIESIVIHKWKCDILFLLLEKISEGWRRSTDGLLFCVVVVLVEENELALPGAAATNDINNWSLSNLNTKFSLDIKNKIIELPWLTDCPWYEPIGKIYFILIIIFEGKLMIVSIV